jgi:FKBP-type peptidyl-prolyl isomerase-like protein
MSRRRWLIAVAVVGLVVIGAAAASTSSVFGARVEPTFKSETEKASYAIGLNLARQLKTIAKDLDDEALAQGFNDGRSVDGKTRLTNQQITATLASLRKTYQQKAAAARTSAGKPVTAVPGISVFFKMDPRLTASYGGDRWVSPPTYTRVGDAKGAAIETRAQAHGANPTAKPASLQWTPSDPGMVQVTPDTGGAVTITVKHAGASIIHVASGEVTKELAVKAETRNEALQVEISQK